MRERCIFSSHSFIKDPPFSRLDLISCRNVMIYLGPELQQKMIPLFHYALRPGGYLFSVLPKMSPAHRDLFSAIDKKHRIFQRKESLPRPAIQFPLRRYRPHNRSTVAEAGRSRDGRSFEGSWSTSSCSATGPLASPSRKTATASISRAQLGRYLEQPTGGPDTNVLNMAREATPHPPAQRPAPGGGDSHARRERAFPSNWRGYAGRSYHRRAASRIQRR